MTDPEAMVDHADLLRKREKENPPDRVCSECGKPGRFLTCDYCLGQTIPLGETPNIRDDRLNAEGLA